MALLQNKKVHFNYEILEKFEAGIELLGLEVKSLKTSKGGSLDGSYVTIEGRTVYLVSAHIPPYQPKNTSKEFPYFLSGWNELEQLTYHWCLSSATVKVLLKNVALVTLFENNML